jgi:hypothetical protein
MTHNTTKPASLQHAADVAVDLFENRADLIERRAGSIVSAYRNYR